MEINMPEQIHNQDIMIYLRSHQKQLKFYEAFFIEHIKKYHYCTKETMIMLIHKYNAMIWEMDDLKSMMNYLNCMVKDIPMFIDTMQSVHKLDFIGINYLLLPILCYYGVEELQVIDYYDYTVQVADALSISPFNQFDLYRDSFNQAKDILDNYQIAGYISILENMKWIKLNLKLDRKKSNDMLLTYEKIYQKEKVEKVKEIVKNVIN